MIKNTHSKVIFLIFCIDIIRIVQYIYSMNTATLKADNLVKLLEGISLLEDRDREQIISVVEALNFAYEKEDTEMVVDVLHCEKQGCMSL